MEESYTCSICLKRLRCSRLGKPETCEHMFCYNCILEWAKIVNSCPVDRIKFNTIEVFNTVLGECVERVYVPDKAIEKDAPDLTQCEVCQSHHRENELLLCDGCDKGYHLDCLSPPLPEVPQDDWYCPVCKPIVDAQHQADFSSSETEASFEWDSSSGSGINTGPRHSESRVVITDTEESESDSDIEEIRIQRTVRNVCAIGAPTVLVSDSSDESEDVDIVNDVEDKRNATDSSSGETCRASITAVTTQTQPSDDSGASYVELLRQFSGSSTAQQPTIPISRLREDSASVPVKMEADSSSRPHLRIKSCSVSVIPMYPRFRMKSNVQTSQASTSTADSQPSTSRPNVLPKMATKKKRRKRKRPKLVLGKRKRSKTKKKATRKLLKDALYQAKLHMTPAQRERIKTRSLARTVASYTPQQNIYRAAVRESYRHTDFSTGLKNARKIILESGASFLHTPQRNFPTPQSGYVYQKLKKIPMRVASEIEKRTVPEGRRLQERSSGYESTPSRSGLSTGLSVTTGGNAGLLDEIRQGLDDLNSKNNIIQRDGTIIPLRDDSSEPVTPTNKDPSPPPQVKSTYNSSDDYYDIVIDEWRNDDSPSNTETDPVNGQVTSQTTTPIYQQQRPCTWSMVDGTICDSFPPSPNGQVHQLTDQATTPIYQQQRPCTWSMVDGSICDSFPPSPHPVNRQVTDQATTPIYQQQRTCTWSMVDGSIRDSFPPSPQEPSSSTVNVTSLPIVQQLIKAELDQYYCIGEVTTRQYQRIFERATSKVMQGKATSVERVKKLVADYVFLYNN